MKSCFRADGWSGGATWLGMRDMLSVCLAGGIGGVVAACGMVATNLGSMRDLVLHTDGGWLAFAMLVFGCAVTFAALAVGGVVMEGAHQED